MDIQNDLDGAPDSAPDNGGDVEVATDTGAQDDNSFGELQDRMAGDDSPWYSPSSGAVVDKDGAVLTNPKTGLPFKSEEEFNQHIKDFEAKKNTAKPKTEIDKTQTQKPMAKSFDFYVRGESDQLSNESLRELAISGSDYKYNDDLVPKIDMSSQSQKQEQKIDPVDQVEKDYQELTAALVNPIVEIKNALLAQGADAQLVEQILGDKLKKATDIVNNEYKKNYRKAMQESVQGPVNERLSIAEQKEQQSIADKNVTSLAQKYYPKGGVDQFYSLINGHTDDKGQFVRGPASQVVDLLVSVANEGKSFPSEKARIDAYSNTYRKLTADAPKAKALFDIAHHYYLGKQLNAAQDMIFSKGKESAMKDKQRIQKTIKTRPASYSSPVSSGDENEGVPKLLRTIQGSMSR